MMKQKKQNKIIMLRADFDRSLTLHLSVSLPFRFIPSL